jgi:hypothetical protein
MSDNPSNSKESTTKTSMVYVCSGNAQKHSRNKFFFDKRFVKYIFQNAIMIMK